MIPESGKTSDHSGGVYINALHRFLYASTVVPRVVVRRWRIKGSIAVTKNREAGSEEGQGKSITILERMEGGVGDGWLGGVNLARPRLCE